jgi:ribulose-5-phosphate 4-epimerase/fuculose-1-phosphate aldolase
MLEEVAVADGAQVSLKGQVSEAEWAARVELAALYRLVAHYGWDDMIRTHISARVPGPEAHFLINPYGWFFDEMTASCLVKVDLDGTVAAKTDQFINPAGFTIHSAIHAARPDVHFVIHLHAEAGVAVSAQTHGLLPLTQHAVLVLPHVGYHDYEGVALNLDERARLTADLGDKSMMILRNHGTLSVGGTAAQAWNWIYFLEKACRQQVLALSAGRGGVLLAPEAAQAEAREQSAGMPFVAGLTWPGLLRLLDRKLPGYDA